MTKLMFACVAALALTACPGKKPEGEAVSKLTEFKDRICACKTPECAKAVIDDEMKWWQALVKETKTMTDEDSKKLIDLNNQFAKCVLDATKPSATK